MMAYGEVDVMAPRILIVDTRSASRPGRFIPGTRIGEQVRPRAVLNCQEKRKCLAATGKETTIPRLSTKYPDPYTIQSSQLTFYCCS
jgi:hypothetical protein